MTAKKLKKFHIVNQVETSNQSIEQMENRLAKYQSLITYTHKANQVLKSQEIIKLTLEIVKELTGSNLVFFYNPHKKHHSYVLEKQLIEGSSVFEVRLDIKDESFVSGAVKLKKVMIHNHCQKDIRYKKDYEQIARWDAKHLMVLPLYHDNKLINVIEAIKTEGDEFDAEDIYFFESIGKYFITSFNNAELYHKSNEQFLQVCQAFADAIGKKDRYTGGHTRRVAHFSKMISEQMNLTDKERKELHISSVLHDLGKIGVEDAILKKNAPLDAAEFEVMKLHPQMGYEILNKIDGLDNILDGVRYHHERPDGKGYPYGLKGEEIPRIARIIAVADTFDAMTSNRPYRKGLPAMIAYEEIVIHSGTQFDSEVVSAFVEGFKKTEMYISEEDPFLKTVGNSEIKKAS